MKFEKTQTDTARKVSKDGVFSGPYDSDQKKLRIWTLFTQTDTVICRGKPVDRTQIDCHPSNANEPTNQVR